MTTPVLSSPRVPLRLRTRVVVLVTTLSLLGFLAICAAGWLVVLRAEDEMLDAFLLPIVSDLAAAADPPSWVRQFPDAATLQTATGLTSLPAAAGWYEGFNDPIRGRAVVITRFADRWLVWRDGELEDEFRLRVPAADTAGSYVWVNVTAFEFTETRTSAIRGSVFGLAAVVVALALVIGLLIARWTLRPVVALAGRVQASRAGQHRRLSPPALPTMRSASSPARSTPPVNAKPKPSPANTGFSPSVATSCAPPSPRSAPRLACGPTSPPTPPRPPASSAAWNEP